MTLSTWTYRAGLESVGYLLQPLTDQEGLHDVCVSVVMGTDLRQWMLRVYWWQKCNPGVLITNADSWVGHGLWPNEIALPYAGYTLSLHILTHPSQSQYMEKNSHHILQSFSHGCRLDSWEGSIASKVVTYLPLTRAYYGNFNALQEMILFVI